MAPRKAQQIRAALLAKGHTGASIAAELRVTRQHVSEVIRGKSVSARVQDAIVAKLGRDPWRRKSPAPAAASSASKESAA